MKVIVNKPKEEPVNTVSTVPTSPYGPPRKSFLQRFIRVCIEDIKSRFPTFEKTYEWDGKTIPKIEPKYK